MIMILPILLLICSHIVWSNQNESQAIPACSNVQIENNPVATRIFGLWKLDYALSRQEGNWFVQEDTFMTEEYRRDDDVRQQFLLSHLNENLRHDMSICAFSSGTFVMRLQMQMNEEPFERRA